MKKIFALLSLIAMLTVVFTSQTLANDHTVMVTQTKFNVTVDTVNYSTFGGVIDKPDIVSNDLYSIIFDTETIHTYKDLPFEVGWTIGKSTIIYNTENPIYTYIDLPFEVGWNIEKSTIINKLENSIVVWKDLPFEVGRCN